MSQQLERGTQNPMRPAQVLVSVAADFVAPVDDTGAATFGATSELTPVLTTELMENSRLNGDHFVLSTKEIILLPGQYRVEMKVTVDNVAAAVHPAWTHPP